MEEVGRELFETMTGEQAGALLQCLVVLVAAFVVGAGLSAGRLGDWRGPGPDHRRVIFGYRFLLVVTAISLLLATGAAFVLMMSSGAREQAWLVELAVTQAGVSLALLVLGAVGGALVRTQGGLRPARNGTTAAEGEGTPRRGR